MSTERNETSSEEEGAQDRHQGGAAVFEKGEREREGVWGGRGLSTQNRLHSPPALPSQFEKLKRSTSG